MAYKKKQTKKPNVYSNAALIHDHHSNIIKCVFSLKLKMLTFTQGERTC